MCDSGWNGNIGSGDEGLIAKWGTCAERVKNNSKLWDVK